MINLNNIKNQKLNKKKLVELLFYGFPLSFILGNLILSLHLLLFIVIAFFLIREEKLPFRFDNLNWILIIFFSYLCLLTAIQIFSADFFAEMPNKLSTKIHPIVKSFLLLRFLILIIILDTLIFNKILNLKKFFLFTLICTSFVSFDVIIQYIIGYDLFGLKSMGWRNSGPFGDEMIAGTYLQRFSFFSIFYMFVAFKNSKNSLVLITCITVLHAMGVLLAGNRMPLMLFLFGCILVILFVKNMRLSMTIGLIIFISMFSIIAKNDKGFGNRYIIFFNAINFIEPALNYIEYVKAKKMQKEKNLNSEKLSEIKESIRHYEAQKSYFVRTSGHRLIYETAIEVWKKQPLFGYGLKSFRVKCWQVYSKDERQLILDEGRPKGCSNHPHQYYLHLLVEAGIIGTVLIVIFIFILLKNSFSYFRNYTGVKNFEIYIYAPIVISFFLEIWPLRSSGSFFTTSNATFIWLIVGMLIATSRKKIT